MNKEELKTNLKDVVQEEFNERNIGYWVGQSIIDKQGDIIDRLDEPKPLTEDQAWKVIADIYNQDADRWEDAKNHYLNSIKEPEKPIVPQFVADWYEESADLEDDLYDLIGETYTSNDKRTEMEEFILSADINPIETIIKMKNGYEVEKEQLYIVKFMECIEYSVFNRDGDGNIVEDGTSKQGTKLTESEIKAIDERYWTFAEEVSS